MATLTPEQQSLVWAVGSRGVAAPGTGLAGVVRIDFDHHTARQGGFVGDVAMQFSKCPVGSMTVCPSLLLCGFLAMLALCVFTNMCQVFQTDDAMWVRVHNAPTDTVVAVLLQPSLSSADRHQATGRGTSAFFLKTLSQACVMIGLQLGGPALF